MLPAFVPLDGLFSRYHCASFLVSSELSDGGLSLSSGATSMPALASRDECRRALSSMVSWMSSAVPKSVSERRPER